jgi:transposase-like protein
MKIAGRWRYINGAVDQYGQIMDVNVASRRDTQAARRFFEALLLAARAYHLRRWTISRSSYPHGYRR